MSEATSTTQKLTKKQKKSLAFRDRKPGKKDSSTTATKNAERGFDLEVNAVPAMEDQDVVGLQCDTVEVPGNKDKEKGKVVAENGSKGDKGKGKQKVEVREGQAGSVGAAVANGKAKKRKRSEEEDGEEQVDAVEGEAKKKKKKAKKVEGEDKDNEKDKAQRFILFVGNLKYTTSKEAILKHFSAVCDPAPTVRLLTPKAKPGLPNTPKSKGCAFLEFKTKVPLQEALKLHQSMLDSRMINVELTAGGGGKSESRLTKVRERNKELLSQRKKRAEKGDKTSIPSQPDRPQRYSATSGLDASAQATSRTWSVGDTVEETHRGGANRKTRGNRAPKSHGTGVNAIPVG
ncbi:RNA binding protein [Coprinopsis marcescibilis]|uniref:RNA binding protein n=1 Tax=Coprinopsis marcescibilis TaxID=230819 RepID=A0A5C3LDX1_COPMA|nr:RNA binding protein [Coprinopsis marcescibilis]